MTSNKFKAVPLALFVLLFAVVLYLWQGALGDLHEYVSSFSGDDFTKHKGWSLYALLIPAIAGLCAYPRVKNLLFYVGSLLVPILLSISYWLWKILGLLFMFGAISGICAVIVRPDKNNDRLESIYFGIGLAYIVARIICSFVSETGRNIADVSYVALLSLTQLYLILRTYFSRPQPTSTATNSGSKCDSKSHYCNTTGFYNGLTIIVLTVVLASGAYGLRKATSGTMLPEETTIEETTSVTTDAKPAEKNTTPKEKQSSTATSSSSQTKTTQTSKEPPRVPQAETKAETKPEATPAPPKVHPFQSYKTSADAGDAAAMYKTAKCYQQGDGVGKSLSSAFNYMYQAAQAGYVPAYFEVAEMFHGGRGTTKDRSKAEFWYQKAADNGNTKAKRILNNM